MKQVPRILLTTLVLATLMAVGVLLFLRLGEARQLEAAVQQARLDQARLADELRHAKLGSSPAPPAPMDPPSAATPPVLTDPRIEAALAELHRWLASHPAQTIPEFELIPTDYWRAVAGSLRPGSEPDLRQGARMLRDNARIRFGQRTQQALATFAQAHAGALPASMAELAPHYAPALTEVILERHRIVSRGREASAPANLPVVGEIAGVNDDFDSVLGVAPSALTKMAGDRTSREIQRALYRYLDAQGGPAPEDPAALAPYLTLPIGPETLSRFTLTRELKVTEKK